MGVRSVFLLGLATPLLAQDPNPDFGLVLRLDRADSISEIRRLRMSWQGSLKQEMKYKLSGDVVGGAQIRDLWIQRELTSNGTTLRVGRFKEPLGLEVLTSVRALAFPERSVASSLAPGRNTGFLMAGHFLKTRGLWAAGVFYNPSASVFGAEGTSGSESALTARLTGIPWVSQDRGCLLQWGAAASLRRLRGGAIQIAAKPENNVAQNIAEGGLMTAGEVQIGQLEGAYVGRRLQVQAEWLTLGAALDSGGRVNYQGWSTQAGWMLLGEDRPWSRERGAPGLVVPAKGQPSLELAGRLSSLDLNDGNLVGGSPDLRSVCLNWYWDEQTRLQAAWILADTESAGEVRSAVLTLQLLF